MIAHECFDKGIVMFPHYVHTGTGGTDEKGVVAGGEHCVLDVLGDYFRNAPQVPHIFRCNAGRDDKASGLEHVHASSENGSFVPVIPEQFVNLGVCVIITLGHYFCGCASPAPGL